jgi:hypothetical protein
MVPFHRFDCRCSTGVRPARLRHSSRRELSNPSQLPETADVRFPDRCQA